MSKKNTAFLSVIFVMEFTNLLFSQVCFEPSISYPISGDAICTTDFNNDGNPDAAVSYGSGSEVNILLGTGTSSFIGGVSISGTVGVMQIISDDFNNDGNYDIATANYDGGLVSIILGNGDGTFGIVSNFVVAPGSNYTSLTSGDFNEDNFADIAIGWAGSFLFYVVYGNGDGTFTNYAQFGLGCVPNAITSGDFNNDGNLDIATSNYNVNSISIALGDGNGSFSFSTDFGTTLECWSIKTADFNNDGNLDLVTANKDVDNVSVYLGDGDGNFSTINNFTVGDYPYSVSVEDFNEDGKQDLAVGNKYGNSVSVLIGDGSGYFSTQPAITVNSQPTGICAADFDNNGNIDFATVNFGGGDVSLVLNNTPKILDALNDTICGVGVGQLSASATDGIIYWYDNSTGGSPVEMGGNFTTPLISATTTFYVETSVGSCTSPRTEVKVVFNDEYDIPFVVTIESGDSYEVGSNSYTSSGIYIDTLFSSNGCDSIVRTTLIVNGTSASYAFSPNNDGINDKWFINDLDLSLDNHVKIFNRWGEEIISFNNYNNDDISWNGLEDSGKNLPDGTYFFTLSISGNQSQSGWVQIVK